MYYLFAEAYITYVRQIQVDFNGFEADEDISCCIQSDDICIRMGHLEASMKVSDHLICRWQGHKILEHKRCKAH